MAQTLVNGNDYDWSQVTATINGTILNGVKAINYELAREKTNNYGSGSKPVSRGRGRKEFTASLTLDMTEMERIQDGAPNRDITDIAPFDVTVTFDNTGKVITHILRNCEFMNNPRALEEGSTGFEIEVDLLPAEIIF